MAFTRKMLKSMGLNDEQVESLIEAHTETVEALKGQLAEAQDKAERFDTVNGELEKLKNSGGNWEKQFADLKAEYEKYKAGVDAEKTTAQKRELLNAMLTDAGINKQAVRQLIEKSYNLDGITIENGAVKDRENLVNAIKTEYADFIGTVENRGIPAQTPPTGGNGPLTVADIKGMTAEQINANWAAVSAALGQK